MYCIASGPPGRNVLQLGASDSVSALKAAEVAARDFTVVDINMGCPKHFSVHAGMGAGLLKTPEVAADIIQTLKRNLSVPISCKIRWAATPSVEGLVSRDYFDVFSHMRAKARDERLLPSR